MRKLLFILSALILTGGGLSAQNHKRAHAQQEQQWKTHIEMMRKSSSEKSPLFPAKADNAEKAPMYPTSPGLQLTPSGPIDFYLDGCNQTQTRAVVVKNVSDEPISATLLSENAKAELGAKISNTAYFSMTEVDGSLYAIDYNMEGVPVKLNAKTFEVEQQSTLYYCYSMAYDGTNLWITGEDTKAVAYNTNFEPTGVSFKTGFSNPAMLVFTGEYLIAVELNWSDGPSHVATFDLEGNQLAQYTLSFPAQMGMAYDAETGLLWVPAWGSLYGIRLQDDKLKIAEYRQIEFEGGLSGFIGGKTYAMDYGNYQNSTTYELELGSLSKSFSFSQTELNLQPGQTATISITANASQGSVEEQFDAPDWDNMPANLFSLPLSVEVDVAPQYEVYGDSVFNTFTGYESTGTMWLKNTGCSEFLIGEPSFTVAQGFGHPVGNPYIMPNNFDGNLYPGDSIGVRIRFYSEEAGNFTSKCSFSIFLDNELIPIAEVALKATAADLEEQLSIARTAIDTTLTECVTTLSVPNKIENNTNVPVTVLGGFDFTFSITTYNYEQEYVVWTLYDANNNVVYSAPFGTYTQPNTTYTETHSLPIGSYRLYLQNWWYDGAITIGNTKTTLVNKATGRGGNSIEFDVTPDDCLFKTTIAPGSSIGALQIPASAFNMSDHNTLYFFAEGIDEPVNEIDLHVDGGVPELSVAESLDFGEQFVGAYPEFKLTLTNTGCAPVYFKEDIYLKAWNEDRDYFRVYNQDAAEFKPSTYIDNIAHGESVELRIQFNPDSVGPFADTLAFTLEGLGYIEVPLSGSGVGAPVADFDDSTIKDTIDFGTPSVTLSRTVKNEGVSNLVITEPLAINYYAGKHNIFCEYAVYAIDNYNNPVGDWDECDYDYSSYVYGIAPGDYKLVIWHDYDLVAADNDAYFIITCSNNVITDTIKVKDLKWDMWGGDCKSYNFTLTKESFKQYTIAPGESLPLTMNIPTSNKSVGSYNYYKYFSTNDPEWVELCMHAQIYVKGDTAVSAPSTLAFGNVQLGTVGKQTFTLTNTGGARFELDYRISGAGFSFVESSADAFGWELAPKQDVELEVTYTPSAAGAATGELKILEYNSEKVLATIALSATGVEYVEPVVSAPQRITAECGQAEVKATHTITNGSSAPLQYATHPRLKVYSGAQDHPQTIWLEIYTLNRWGEFVNRVVYIPAGTYTVSGKMYEQVLDLPAGDYGLRFRDTQNSGYSNRGYVSVVVDGKSILKDNSGNLLDEGYNYSNSTNFRISIPEAETYEVPANGSKEFELTYSLEGLTGGEYTFTKVLDRMGTTKLTCDTLVTIVTIESKLEKTYSKDEVEFVPVHVGNHGYASVVLENTGCEGFYIDDWDFAVGGIFSTSDISVWDLNVGNSSKISLEFYPDAPEVGTFRDTLLLWIYDYNDALVSIDSIPLVATANNTQVMAVSTPTVSGSYRVGEEITISISFDAEVELNDDEATAAPQLLLNTGGQAQFIDNFDGYTLQFVYTVAATDNVEKLAIESINWNGIVVVDEATGDEITVAALPANTEFVATNITLDNIAPTYTVSTSATETTESTATVTVAFNEEVTDFAESNITLSEGASVKAFTTADNITYVAELSLPHAAVTSINIAANAADLAGNTVKVEWAGSIASLHDFDTTVFAATFDSVGYTMLICKICGDTIYTDTVPVLEVKVVDVALSNLPKKLTYTEGEVIDLTGAKLTLTFNNGTTKVIDLTSAMISGFDPKKTGKQTVTVTYVENGETFTVTFDININKKDDTAIDEDSAEINIYAFNRTIVIEAAEAINGEIAVFDVNGRMIAKELAAGTRTEIEMPAEGIYIVSVNGESKRVAVY
ncbi:MAG: choice-of-anchor D domain-containing protein [Salinivirgaceae bacterium]|nr:choice-of-anchor D domain-containing protein [Salinivirgaceae bacterium]